MASASGSNYLRRNRSCVVDNPWTGGPLVIAHQGGAAEAPSSTLYAFATARRNGAQMFELDVHATADGHLVVLHDPTVDGFTDGTGQVDQISLDAIQRLDAAHWFEPGVGVAHASPVAAYALRGIATGAREAPAGFGAADFTVPTLETVLRRFPDVLVNVDIKQTAPETTPYEAEVADVVRRTGRTHNVMVGSFSDAALAEFRRLAPEVATSAAPEEVLAFWSYVNGHAAQPDEIRYRALQVPEVFGDLTVVTDRFVAAAHEAGVAVHVWTIDDEASMHRLLDFGVDGIVTDRPSVLAAVVEDRRLRGSN
jgi:glycerophosphoryl diester phosphodiesterase